MGWALMGKRVALAASGNTEYGTYAEYCVAEAATVISIPNELSFNEAASSFFNPLSVIAMCEVAKDHKAKFVIHSAAASQLGRQMVRYFHENGIQVICIVRREEQIDILKKEGAKFILNSENENFTNDLKELCK